MAKIKIVVKVPDNECFGCPYLHKRWVETGYMNGYDKYTCSLFDCEIVHGKRCIACRSCEVE